MVTSFNNDFNWGKLAEFFINILLIPYSNFFVERMYSLITISTIFQIKSYYDEEDVFEPNEDH